MALVTAVPTGAEIYQAVDAVAGAKVILLAPPVIFKAVEIV